MIDIVDIRGRLARHASKRYSARALPPFYLVVHHGATAAEPGSATLEAYARYHVGKGWPGIGYHCGVSPDGLAYRLNDDSAMSYHVGTKDSSFRRVWPSHPFRAKGWPRPTNHNSLGVVLAGNFEHHAPPAAQWAAAVRLFQHLADHYPRAIIIGHREVPAAFKTCPGTAFDLDRFIREVRNADVPNLAKAADLREWYDGHAHEPLGELYDALARCPDEGLRQVVTAHVNAANTELVAAGVKE